MAKQTKKEDKGLTFEQQKELLGKRIRQIRKAKGHNNYMKFAFDFEFSPNMVHLWEKGNNISLESLSKLAKALNVPIRDFFQDI